MNYLKRISIIFVILLLCGCTVKYDLHVKNDGTFVETITGEVSEKELDNGEATSINNYSYALYNATPLINDEVEYSKNIIDKKGYKQFEYTFEYNNNFSQSRVLNICFDNAEFKETDDYYYFSAYGKFNCHLAKKTNVSITSDYGALENNADKVDGNTYIWYLKEGENADIFLMLSKNVKAKNQVKIPFINTFEIIGLILLIISTVILYMFYKKKYKDNLN